MSTQKLEIDENRIANAQEEMKIVSSFVFNDIRTIHFTRYFLIGALTSLITYALIYHHRDFFFLILAFLIIFSAAIIEGVTSSSQNSHINRLWQLDRSINRIIFKNMIEKGEDFENLPVIFRKKKIYVKDDSGEETTYSRLRNLVRSPSFILFYIVVSIITGLFFFTDSSTTVKDVSILNAELFQNTYAGAPSWLLAIATVVLALATIYYALVNRKIFIENRENRKLTNEILEENKKSREEMEKSRRVDFLKERIEKLYNPLRNRKDFLWDYSTEPYFTLQLNDRMNLATLIGHLQAFSYLASEDLFPYLDHYVHLFDKLQIDRPNPDLTMPDYQNLLERFRKIARRISELAEPEYEKYEHELYELIEEKRRKLSITCPRCKQKIYEFGPNKPCILCDYNPSWTGEEWKEFWSKTESLARR